MKPLLAATLTVILAGCAVTTTDTPPVAVTAGTSVAPAPTDAVSSATPVASVSALPVFAKQAGMIAFMREGQTWTACADLTHAKQLTSVAGRTSGFPVWSPDGSRIAIDTDRDDPDTADGVYINDVFTMNADGTDVRKLTDSKGVSGDPAYSPDGKLIAVEADRGGGHAKQGIYVMNARDGSDLRRVTAVTDEASDDHAPRFSPDGKRLVFTRNVNQTTAALFVVDLDGSNVLRITPDTMIPGDAVWSPDGTEIVFEADTAQYPRGGAWVIRPDGTGLRSLTPQGTDPGVTDGFSDPVWSPDGTVILLLHGRYLDDDTSTVGLAMIRPDGSDLGVVADGTGNEDQPDWTRSDNC
jgi:Tol biopolymer transport system component